MGGAGLSHVDVTNSPSSSITSIVSCALHGIANRDPNLTQNSSLSKLMITLAQVFMEMFIIYASLANALTQLVSNCVEP